MKLPAKKALPKKRNLAAKALRDPLFRPKVVAEPAAYQCRNRINKEPDDTSGDEQIN